MVVPGQLVRHAFTDDEALVLFANTSEVQIKLLSNGAILNLARSYVDHMFTLVKEEE